MPRARAGTVPQAVTGSARFLIRQKEAILTTLSDASETMPDKIRVKIMGVGGTGILALQQVMSSLSGLSELGEADIDLEFWELDSDLKSRTYSTKGRFVQLGPSITRGRGTDGDAQVGQQAALESREAILAALTGATIVFILAGASGGIGAGAAPVIADLARTVSSAPGYWNDYRPGFSERVPTIAYLISHPPCKTGHDGQRVLATMSALRGKVDSLIVLNEDGATPEIGGQPTSRLIDLDIQLILNLAFLPGLVGVDFSDVRHGLMEHRGFAHVAVGRASGTGHASKAARKALEAASLGDGIALGTSVLFLVKGGSDLTRYHVTEAAEVIYDAANQEAEILLGASPFMQASGEIEVIVHVTGLPSFRPACTATSSEVSWTC